MTSIVLQAEMFAEAAHAAVRQVRKYTNEPYIVHPRAVVGIVQSVRHDANMLAAAWLHDVIEDTGVEIELIERKFGADIASLVGWLTDDTNPAQHGNRAARRAISREKLRIAPARAQTIKIADLIDNTKSIVEHDPDFAAVYLREKAELLVVMRDGDKNLWRRASTQVDEAEGSLAA